MNKETRDTEIQITSSWPHNCYKLDLTEITVSYNCANGTMTILDSTILAPERFFADVASEERRVNDLLKPLGLKTVSSSQYQFQYCVHKLTELDGAQQRKCSDSVEAMRFVNSIAQVLGKKPDTYTKVVVSREVLVSDSWIPEGKALCEEALK